MFAALNVMRLDLMEKLNLDNMELSQNYPLFYDKLEKANYFLENMLDTLDEPRDGRVVSFLLKDPLGDGGQWDMFRSLVEKYGVVPKDLMPETTASSATAELRKYMTTKLREYACELRTAHEAGEDMEALRARKDKMMETVYRMLCIALGKPPVRFTWETRDKDKKFIRISDITPQEFFKQYIGWNLADMVGRRRCDGSAVGAHHFAAERLLLITDFDHVYFAVEVKIGAGHGKRRTPLACAGLGRDAFEALFLGVISLRYSGVELVAAAGVVAFELIVDVRRGLQLLLEAVSADQR